MANLFCAGAHLSALLKSPKQVTCQYDANHVNQWLARKIGRDAEPLMAILARSLAILSQDPDKIAAPQRKLLVSLKYFCRWMTTA